MKPNSQITLTPLENGIKVTSSGDDPQLFLPAFAKGKQLVLQVVIQSPVVTPAQLFYCCRADPALEEQFFVLKPGKNTIYYRLDSPSLIDQLRFDRAVAGRLYMRVSRQSSAWIKTP